MNIKTKDQEMHDLLNLSKDQSERLAKRVNRWGGLVRIFVHPLFEKWHWPPQKYHTHPEYESIIKIEHAISRLIKKSEDSVPPLVFMEEHYRVLNLSEWMINNGIQEGCKEVYYIPTFKADPEPYIDAEESIYGGYVRKNYGLECWDVIMEQFKKFGISRILLGGMTFKAISYKIDWTRKGPFVSGCVGIALSRLSSDKPGKFECELSALVDCADSRRLYNKCVMESKKNRTLPIESQPKELVV